MTPNQIASRWTGGACLAGPFKAASTAFEIMVRRTRSSVLTRFTHAICVWKAAAALEFVSTALRTRKAQPLFERIAIFAPHFRGAVLARLTSTRIRTFAISKPFVFPTRGPIARLA